MKPTTWANQIHQLPTLEIPNPMTYDPKENNYISALEQYRSSLADLQSKWTLETVKHLALINIAGIAGATTLSQLNESTHIWSLRVAVIVFFAGLIFAVIDFYLNSIGYWVKLKDTDRARLSVSRSKTTEEASRHGWPNAQAGDVLFKLAALTGWLSALCAISGSVIIGISLLCTGAA